MAAIVNCMLHVMNIEKPKFMFQSHMVSLLLLLLFLSGWWALSLRLWLCVPVLSTVPLPVPLSHHHSGHHGDHHSDSDDEHSGRLCYAKLAVHPSQRSPGQLRRVPACHILVVINVEVANMQDLTEDAVQLAVTVPWITWGQWESKCRNIFKNECEKAIRTIKNSVTASI